VRPLSGLAVKVTTGFFLIGLSSTDADRERNVQLLKGGPGSIFRWSMATIGGRSWRGHARRARLS
jgi:hypothetical protein